jgi:hypothetical protein
MAFAMVIALQARDFIRVRALLCFVQTRTPSDRVPFDVLIPRDYVVSLLVSVFPLTMDQMDCRVFQLRRCDEILLLQTCFEFL